MISNFIFSHLILLSLLLLLLKTSCKDIGRVGSWKFFYLIPGRYWKSHGHWLPRKCRNPVTRDIQHADTLYIYISKYCKVNKSRMHPMYRLVKGTSYAFCFSTSCLVHRTFWWNIFIFGQESLGCSKTVKQRMCETTSLPCFSHLWCHVRLDRFVDTLKLLLSALT